MRVKGATSVAQGSSSGFIALVGLSLQVVGKEDTRLLTPNFSLFPTSYTCLWFRTFRIQCSSHRSITALLVSTATADLGLGTTGVTQYR